MSNIERNVQITKKLQSIYNYKKISIKSLLFSINETGSGLDEESTIYCQMDVTDVQYGPDFLYFYGKGKDRFIIAFDDSDIEKLNFNDVTEESELTIHKRFSNMDLEIRIALV